MEVGEYVVGVEVGEFDVGIVDGMEVGAKVIGGLVGK